MGCSLQTDPGANKVTNCFLYMQVKDGKFVRFYPKKVNTFDCDPELRLRPARTTFGGGAKLKAG